MSPFTRNIIRDVAMKIDSFVTTNPKVPPAALQYYTKAKNAFADKPPSAEKTDKKTQ
jgi:propanediol dehydratase small subunit